MLKIIANRMWITRHQASLILQMTDRRCGAFLVGSNVARRVIPYGTRKQMQFLAADVYRLRDSWCQSDTLCG